MNNCIINNKFFFYYIFEFNGRIGMLILELDRELSDRIKEVMGKPAEPEERRAKSLLDDED